MPFPLDQNEMFVPGLESILETVQNQFWWGSHLNQIWQPATLLSSALDAGNTVTTTLRGGLLLGKVASSGKLKEWNPTGTDGSEVIYGILPAPISMLTSGSSVADRFTYVMVAGTLLGNRLLVPGNGTETIVGDALEYQIVSQLAGRFLFDTHIGSADAGWGRARFRRLTAAEITVDAVTVAASDHGRTFIMTGADGNTTFTPPAAKVGLTFHFWNNVATHNLVVTPASGSVKLPDADGTAATFTLGPGESASITGTAAGEYQYLAGCEAATD
jgi:plastocyanin